MRALTLSLFAALLAGIGLAGCDQIDTGKGPVVDSGKPTNDAAPPTTAEPKLTPPVSPPVTPPVTAPPGTTADTTPPPGTRPDNTAINQRDAADLNKAKTPIDQDEDPADLAITQKIRQHVMGEKEFSLNAQNVKIMTQDGMVTLRGPVNSKAEADKIGQFAKEAAGDGKVDNQLEVVPQER